MIGGPLRGPRDRLVDHEDLESPRERRVAATEGQLGHQRDVQAAAQPPSYKDEFPRREANVGVWSQSSLSSWSYIDSGDTSPQRPQRARRRDLRRTPTTRRGRPGGGTHGRQLEPAYHHVAAQPEQLAKYLRGAHAVVLPDCPVSATGQGRDTTACARGWSGQRPTRALVVPYYNGLYHQK